MKIKVKGFKSLIKAVQNRAHLFPVKVLVNGKTKTYYSIRYKTGNKAMEIAKKQMKIPNNVEALFDTKDGKRKNLTENDVLRIYDKAGKPGSLQDFIKKNFKKPYVKPRNSTTVDLEQQQMSIDDLMQGNNKKNNKETSGKEKTEKLWQEFEKWRVKANNDLSGIVRSYHKDIEDMNASEYKSIMEHFFKEEIARGYTQNGETIDECLENYIQMFKDQIKDKEDRKNAWNDDYYKEIYNHLEKMHEKGDWTFELDAKKYLRQFLRDKVGLDRYAAQNAGKAALKDILAKNDGDKKEEKKKEPESGITITGPIYDDERPTYYINDNGNVIETQDTKIVDQYRQKQKESKNQAGTDYKDDNANNKNTGGENPDKENKNKENEDKKNAWNDDYYKTFYEKLDAIYKKYRGSISFFSPEAELILKEFIADKVGLDREAAINAWKAAIEELVVPKPNNENQKDIPKDADGGLDFAKLFEKDRALKEQRDKQWVKERNAEVEPRKSIVNGDYGKVRKYGTKKIMSNGEYPKAKDLNDFTKKVKTMKDFHLDIKGRAILDMFDIKAPLFNKRNGKPISLNKHLKVGGYCYRSITGETTEIALMAETGDSVWETENTIHECMHSKLKNSVSKAISEMGIKSEVRRETIRSEIEETIAEMAGQGVNNLIHGSATDKKRWSYEKIIAQAIPRIWGTPEFAEARKKGLHGIGQEICKRLMNNDTSFVENVVQEYLEAPIDNQLNGKIENRMQAIEWAITGNEHKVVNIQYDTGKSEIANLVEELKRGTISLQAALNSSQYREIAAILITKFLEEEDLDVLDGAAEQIKYGNEGQAEIMASGRIPF